MDEQEENNELMEVNSDSDSSSTDEEAEQALIAKAEELERQLSDNKYLYNAHDELVKVYRELGDLTSLRQAYERFHEYFPLTPEIWLGWINIEKKLATSETEIKHVFKLFEDAVEDYLSVHLWMEYAQYSLGSTSLDTTRQIIEKGLTAAGLHAADGSLLWDTLREIEFTHLSLEEEGSDKWKEELTRIAEVFRRQLSIPLLQMETTYAEWKEWLDKLPKDHTIKTDPIEWGYNKALKTLQTYKPYEDKILVTTDETELLKIYKEYIKTITDPSTILCVYERAVAQMCLNITIWQDYCLYAFKLGDPADKISSRALRNCPWSEELWVLRLRILENLNREEKQMIACFEQGMSNLTQNQGLDLWLTYLEYICRNSSDKDKIYKNFDQALEQLKYQNDGILKITKWYARILAKNGDMLGARRLWKNILKNPQNKSSANIWLEFVSLERQYGDSTQVRSLYQRALTNCGDWGQYIADEWLMFERETGKLSDVMKCLEKHNELVKTPAPITQTPEPKKGEKRKSNEETKDSQTKKFKFEKEEPLRKKVVKDPTTTVFVSNLHTTVNEKKLKKMFPNAVNIEVVTDRSGKSRCYGYVQFNLEEEVMHALARDREPLDGRPVFISNCKPNRTERHTSFKYSQEEEANKLFVKGLPLDKSEDDIKILFESFGVKDVRLVRRRDGQSKGIAYVELNDDENAKKAISKTDQMKIGENTISVAISAPPPKKPTIPKPAPPARHSRSKLQLPLIPRALQVKSTSNGEEKPVQKSNQDFRNMLLNK